MVLSKQLQYQHDFTEKPGVGNKKLLAGSSVRYIRQGKWGVKRTVSKVHFVQVCFAEFNGTWARIGQGASNTKLKGK